jgi:hypothetical protein
MEWEDMSWGRVLALTHHGGQLLGALQEDLLHLPPQLAKGKGASF